jgi:general secretion pathway protein D
LSAAVQLMDSFGTVKVLSSPKLSVMNNQTAMLRVVDNYVYFTIQSNTTTNQTSSQTTYTSTPNSVPVGFTMSVTPQINDNSSVLLNLRPSITRLFGYVNDPNPSLSNPCAGVANCTTPAIVSKIPQTQTREMESILRIENNQIAVMGGLMQDEIDNYSDEIPFLGRIPFLGNLFKNRNDSNKKSELVIFIRPIVIKESGIEGDYSEFRSNLPGSDFLEDKSRKVEPQEKQKL